MGLTVFGVVQLGSNPWVNAFISALFITFGLSLLGAFEITIPSSILTRLNASSEKGGFAGTLLMGLTFSLASFACGNRLAQFAGGFGDFLNLLGRQQIALSADEFAHLPAHIEGLPDFLREKPAKNQRSHSGL